MGLIDKDTNEWETVLLVHILLSRKQFEGRTLLFLVRKAKMKLIKKCPYLAIKQVFVERCRDVIVLDKAVGA